MKALCLFSLDRAESPADCPDPPYTATLIKRTLSTLASNFRPSFPFLPIFVTGSTWKRCMLGGLLKHSRPDLDKPKICFQGDKKAADGVYVWPEPVQIGGVTFMLLKLRKPISKAAPYMELRRKVTMGLAMLSSVCCLCENQEQVLPSLDAFVEDYTSIRQSSSLEMSKLLVCIEDSCSEEPEINQAYDRRRREHASLLDIRGWSGGEVDDPWVQTLVDILGDPQFHQPFQRSHSRFFENRPFLPWFVEFAVAFVQKANETPTFDDFVSEFRSYSPPCMKSLCLIELTPPSGSQSSTAQINPETVGLLRANFAQTKEFFPVFDYCLAGRSSLFGACLKQVFPDLEDPESCFENGKVDGVYVWPKPVQMGNVTLMLLKLGRPIYTDATYLELRRKVMIGLAMLSSVCYLSEESPNVLNRIKDFLQDYEFPSLALQLEMSKVEVYIDESQLINQKLADSSRPSLDFIKRNSEAIDHQRDCLADYEFHQVFQESHSNFFGGLPYMRGFMHWTTAFVEKSNQRLNYSDYMSQLYACLPPCTKALRFLEFIKDEDQSYSAQLVGPTVQTLTTRFNSTSFYPVFVCGSREENSLLVALLKCARPDLENLESCFECGEGAVDGVDVWPEPVHIGEVTLMLLKLKTPSTEDAAYAELMRKVRMGLAILSSVCFLPENKKKALNSIDAFIRDYTAISQQMHLEISKLLALVDLKADIDARISAPFLETISKEPNQWTSQLLTLLQTREFHLPFTNTHHSLCRKKEHCISAFARWTDSLIKMTNFNLGFDSYVARLPDLSQADAETVIAKHIILSERDKIVVRESETLQFVIKTESQHGLHLSLKAHTQERILQKYNSEEPLVVLMLLGAPGLGKSTLLNDIGRFCTETLSFPEKFKTGNTGEHTTTDSLVLSHPLSYKNRQIMTIDLQGLGGTDTANIDGYMIQKNLMSALLTLASVPCILIVNEVDKIIFVREVIMKIATLQEQFGFYTERIFLLFHDKEIIENQECVNIEFVQCVNDLNRLHFDGRKVIKILNKPNFGKANIDVQRQLFLRTLLDDSLFTKKRVSQTPEPAEVKLKDLLAYLSAWTTHERDMSEMQLSPENNRELSKVIERKVVEIRQIQQQTISHDNCLVKYFNSRITGEFDRRLDNELAVREIFRRYCKERLAPELSQIRAELLVIENCYTFIRLVEKKQMKKILEDLVEYFYNTYYTALGFLPKVDELIKKLELV